MLAFVFPGQGSQRVGMGKALVERFPIARRTFEQADAALGMSISRLCFEGPAAELELTEHCQPAILTLSVAMLRVLTQESGLSPVWVAGHSLGEFSALVCAEALEFEDALRLVRARGRAMQRAVPVGDGGMVAVLGVERSVVEALCLEAAGSDVLCPANFNGGGQVVVAGHTAALERLRELGAARGALIKPLHVSAPFHCPLMLPAAAELEHELAGLTLRAAKVPVVCNADGLPHTAAAELRRLAVQQLTAPVQWEASLAFMRERGVREFIAIGDTEGKFGAMLRRNGEALRVASLDDVASVSALAERARGELNAFVGPLGQWQIANDGSVYAQDRSKVIWAEDGALETVDDLFWHVNANGTLVRRFGGPRVFWADGRLEVLERGQWRARRDGAFVREDGARIIYSDGNVEDFLLADWERSEDGAMQRKDKTRVIWPDGLEWSFRDPEAHGF